MIKESNVAYGVRVKLNSNFEVKCLGDNYLKDEEVLFIDTEKSFNDVKGPYVTIKGGSLINSGYAYFNQLDLEFPVPEIPLYNLYGAKKLGGGMRERFVEWCELTNNPLELTRTQSIFLDHCITHNDMISGIGDMEKPLRALQAYLNYLNTL